MSDTTKSWIKAGVAVIAAGAVALVVAALIPTKAKADMDSDQRNPGKDKEEATVIEQKITEFGTAIKGWAIAFGHDATKSAADSKQAFLNDMERLKNSQFVQDQQKGFEQAKVDLANTGEDIQKLPARVKDGTTDLFNNIGKALGALFGAKDDTKNQK